MDDNKSFSFAEGIITPEHVICGVQLYPFNLAHWSYLEDYCSPILSEQLYPDAVYDDPLENQQYCYRHIMLFIMVCAHTYEDNKRLNEDPIFCQETKTIFEDNVSKYIKTKKHWNVYQEIIKLREYLDYYINSMPEFSWTPSAPSGVDWKYNIYDVLKSEHNYSESEIMNMSIRRLYSEWVTFVAKSGSIKVKTKRQIEAEKQAAEYVAKIKSGEVKLEGTPCQ